MGRIFRWIALGVSALIALLFVLTVAAALRGPSIPDKAVLHLVLDGQLVEAPGVDLGILLGRPRPSTVRSVCESVRRAAADGRVVGLLLEVKRPEVGLAQVQELEDAMAVFRASGKWNTAFIETAGEGEKGDVIYALAVMADTVVLAPPGDVNIVGLRAESMFFAGLLEKLGVQAHFEKRKEYKAAANMFTERGYTPEHLESVKQVVDDMQLDLVRHIAARRKVKVDDAWTWLRTGPHLGTTAVEKKLVDRLAYWDEIENEVDALAGGDDKLLDIDAYWMERSLHEEGPRLALIFGEGQILRGHPPSDPFGGDAVMGSDDVAEAFREAREAGVKGVLFRVDSPGGSYIASDLIRREVELTRKAGIPVVVSMGNAAASGGYFVSMAADHIVAQPGTLTGSIGVYAGAFALKELFAKVGVTTDAYATTERAAAFAPMAPLDEVRVEVLRRGADRVYEDFVGKMAAARHKTPEQAEEVARGRVWSGRAALERGLVDELGGMELALRRLQEKAGLTDVAGVSLEIFPPPKPPLQVIADLLTGQAALSPLSLGVPRELALTQAAWRAADEAEHMWLRAPLRTRIE